MLVLPPIARRLLVVIGFVLRTVGFLELLCLFKTSLLDLIKGGGVQLSTSAGE
jgi:hypothetical protein